MIKFRFIVVLMIFIFSGLLFASSPLGPDPSVYGDRSLKWEDGAYGYHVMFKSLLKSMNPNPDNPQADTCIDPAIGSTYTLEMDHIPVDAYIQDAFLVWSGAVRTTKLNDPTDNEVQFSFVSSDGRITENQTVRGRQAFRVVESEGFEFEAFRDLDNPNHAFFTYRVDVTDFFQSIHEKGRALEIDYDGFSLYGNYTLSGLECTDEKSYADTTELVSGWKVVLIYTSSEISPKKVYFYNGFQSYWHQESEISVTGFEFPIDPEVRLTLAVLEGDINLATINNPRGGPFIPEGLHVQGDQYGWLMISDICNPEAYIADGFEKRYYTEIFNQISSVYGWADEEPTCIGGVPPAYNYDEIEWSLDVDTFVMDSSRDGAYAAHFNRGGQRIGLKIGANQDMIITNFMIVSVDTKAPTFDIPNQPEKIACTPANDPEKWCETGEHTFAIRVQNWGDDLTGRVTVRDTVPDGMTYVPGSTEYATEFDVVDGEKIARRWTSVPDQGGFPLENGIRVKDTMEFCPPGSNYLDCEELVIVRFRVTVNPGIPKHTVIENVAQIETPGFTPYNTNLGIPARLTFATSGCVSNQEDVDLSKCGGEGAAGCEEDTDCEDFYICDPDAKVCVPDPDIERCKDSDVEVKLGRNTSSPDDTVFIKPQSDLVVGQVQIVSESGKDCYFNLSSLKLRYDIDDSNIQLSNFRLVKDEKGSGAVDSGDAAIASAESLIGGLADFSPTDPANRLWSNTANHFLFLVDVGYREGETVPRDSIFRPSIEAEGIMMSDEGSPKISGLPLKFSKFQIQPEDAFVVTRGLKDPPVPPKNEMNKTRDILQLRIFSGKTDDKINSIRVAIPGGELVRFGTGITSLAIYEDTNNDGSGDKEIASVTSTDDALRHTFRDLNIAMEADKERFFTVRAGLSLNDVDKMQIQVSHVTVESGRDVLGLPVNSKLYEYECNPLLEDCGEEGCTCTVVSVNSSDGTKALLMFFLMALMLLFSRKISGVIKQ